MDDIPADAPTQAERRWRLLRFAHLNQTLWGLAITTLLLVGARLPQVVTDDPALRPLQIPGDLWLFAVIYTEWLHHRLRPWCPYCRPWDDGGDEEPAPDPTLFDTKTGG